MIDGSSPRELKLLLGQHREKVAHISQLMDASRRRIKPDENYLLLMAWIR
jgi:hypothetical protein